jgi:hypothetical protein
MTPTIPLSLCGILIFGVGGFMLVWDTEKVPLITRIGACVLLVIGAGLFVTGLLGSNEPSPTGLAPDD